ncbi:MAG: hypothetical protein R3C11_16550 [Planctomycetaceae bacterium]
MAKQMWVTLPFLLLLLDLWPLRRISFSSVEPPLSQDKSVPVTVPLKQLVLEKIPLLGLSILFSIIIYLAQQEGGAVQDSDQFPLMLRMKNALLSYGLYIRKTFLPTDLAPIYPHPGFDINTQSVLISAGSTHRHHSIRIDPSAETTRPVRRLVLVPRDAGTGDWNRTDRRRRNG